MTILQELGTIVVDPVALIPPLFTEAFGDARLAELRLLVWVERQVEVAVPNQLAGPWVDLVMSLVSDGLLTDFSYERGKSQFIPQYGSSPAMVDGRGIVGESLLERALTNAKVGALDSLYQGFGGAFHLTHRGRVRLSELKQALRSGRERDSTGLLWDARHWQQDLQVALLDATEAAPLSVVYLDMNGLKKLNDTSGHDAGDQGLRSYFQSVLSVLGDTGQAYRLGGDEVLVILPGTDGTAAARAMERVCRLLMGEKVDAKGASMSLSVSAGVVSLTDLSVTPLAASKRADSQQYRAKEKSRASQPRPSVIAVEGVAGLVVVES